MKNNSKSYITVRYLFDKLVRFFFSKCFRDIPWVSPQAFFYMRANINKYSSILELGSGSSTIWFLSKGLNLVTLESSEEWLLYVKKRCRAPIFHITKTDEIFECIKNSSSDILFIDAFDRPQILEFALSKNTFKLIILDDAQRYFNIRSKTNVEPKENVFQNTNYLSNSLSSSKLYLIGDSISKTLFINND